jgi:hypothetical protein
MGNEAGETVTSAEYRLVIAMRSGVDEVKQRHPGRHNDLGPEVPVLTNVRTTVLDLISANDSLSENARYRIVKGADQQASW